MAALMAIELATGWDPNEAEVVVGTSSGSFVAALLRNEALTLDSLVMPSDNREDVAERIRSHVFIKGPSLNVGKWVRHGILPGVRRPGLTLFLGSPARFHAGGIADWVTTHIGSKAAISWPDRPTAIVAHDLRTSSRTVFGTDSPTPWLPLPPSRSSFGRTRWAKASMSTEVSPQGPMRIWCSDRRSLSIWCWS